MNVVLPFDIVSRECHGSTANSTLLCRTDQECTCQGDGHCALTITTATGDADVKDLKGVWTAAVSLSGVCARQGKQGWDRGFGRSFSVWNLRFECVGNGFDREFSPALYCADGSSSGCELLVRSGSGLSVARSLRGALG